MTISFTPNCHILTGTKNIKPITIFNAYTLYILLFLMLVQKLLMFNFNHFSSLLCFLKYIEILISFINVFESKLLSADLCVKYLNNLESCGIVGSYVKIYWFSLISSQDGLHFCLFFLLYSGDSILWTIQI